jgi:hypothetical protein
MYKNGGKVIPRKMGVRTASTFFGFCSRHDTEMFRPVEYGHRGLTNENCFLLSFRALAYEVIMKRCALCLAHRTARQTEIVSPVIQGFGCPHIVRNSFFTRRATSPFHPIAWDKNVPTTP